ncbi:hypothetical protein NDU88_006686 [Pleurodeles waltl]|uniref:Uncharacterized protein n=1 Tax=Pleurodeles waltl TaxID=8319 RepID=A0AAV7VQK6_PLEWA|nr:hypothetical protein NDU88_006686 [Pleurodeles waltl]
MEFEKLRMEEREANELRKSSAQEFVLIKGGVACDQWSCTFSATLPGRELGPAPKSLLKTARKFLQLKGRLLESRWVRKGLPRNVSGKRIDSTHSESSAAAEIQNGDRALNPLQRRVTEAGA